MIGLDFTLFPIMHVQGLALAHSLGYVAGCAVALIPLRRAVGGLDGRRTVIEMAKVVLACAVMALAMLAAVGAVDAGLRSGDGRDLLEVATGGVVGLVSFAAAAWALRVRDMAFFVDLLPTGVRRAVRLAR
jgi:peptidoglycan biosynthesis protein MviN/MurJ (putative lipid II flippase)